MKEDVRQLHDYMQLHTFLHFHVEPDDPRGLKDYYRFCVGCRLLQCKDETWHETEWVELETIDQDEYWHKLKRAAKAAGIDLRTLRRPGT